MANEGKAMDAALDTISVLQRQRKRALKLIDQFVLADSTLWPILSEIQLALKETDK